MKLDEIRQKYSIWFWKIYKEKLIMKKSAYYLIWFIDFSLNYLFFLIKIKNKLNINEI